MGIDFLRPLAWLLLPVCIVLVLLIDRLGGRRVRGLKLVVARVMRVVIVTLFAAALAGPALLLPGNQAATWVLADLSASVSGQRGVMEKSIDVGLALAPKDLQVGTIAFGADAMVDAPLALGRTGVSLTATPDAGATDIGRALSMALALLPEDAAGRIALLSDGKDNVQDVQGKYAALLARGVPVDVLPFDSGFARDAQITALTPPAQVYQGEKFDVVVRIDSLYETEATLVLYANQSPVDTREVTLRRGENTFVFQDRANASGVVTYEVQLVAQNDENPRNDRLGAYMDVRGIPNILIVGDGTELAPMLEAAGMNVRTVLAGQLPRSVDVMRQYHAIALVNVNDDDLHSDAVAALDAYVQKLGRGVAVFGGDDSYALGGWRGSALEDMLPVTMDVDNRLQMPSLSLVLVIDKSGSMTEGRYGITRLDMAKEAAMRSTEVLTARDSVGVIAFDDTAKWVVPMQQVTDLGAIQDMIGTIRPGGGTMFYSALAQSLGALVNADSQLKHIIFLTDGEAADGGYEGIVQQMAANGITMTTVAVGGGANVALLARLAEWGGGRAYTADEFDDIPKVFTKETVLATQAYVQNRTFYPVIWSSGTLTNYDAFPPLDGYLSTTAKPLATVTLATDTEEPLLAWWQYGAGRVIAWTSDTRGAWTGDFLRWEQAAEFFAGIFSHILPEEEGEGELDLSRNNDTLQMTYTIPEDASNLTTEATVLAPDGSQQRVALQATAPGVYEGEAVATQEGAYAVRVEQRSEDELVRTLESGVAVGYSAEYDIRTADGRLLLEEIAAATGGRILSDPAELFMERGAQKRARYELTTVLLIIALVLFVLDAAQRRLAWERWIPQRAPKAAPEPPQQPKAGSGKAPPPPLEEETAPQAERTKPSDTAEKLLQGRKKKLL